ncbi:hypothetical protein [Dactylococcopsis salina]|uniref:Uncharacterized protein n=1 Tax=Dactylococcopsis salina (strain PCC 8305) TaxID=13035 RepID=K9YW65_DACS8|nr:hypothetical protein [Dactylococcopsis salina]AFZ50737.1 hypothetical protein Dacsa_2103 [Dactylococcopsis salina PCC 8305]
MITDKLKSTSFFFSYQYEGREAKTMSISTLPHSQELTDLLGEWGNLPVDSIPNRGESDFPCDTNQADLHHRNRELVQRLCQLSNLIAYIASQISKKPSNFTKEELNQLANLASDQLEITSYSLVEVDEKLSWLDPTANESYKNLSLFKRTLAHLETVTENLIRVVTQAEINHFQSQQQSAYSKISLDQIQEARQKLT